MMSIVQNLRIGTKLAITSALSILLVATMIYLQVSGGAEVRTAAYLPRWRIALKSVKAFSHGVFAFRTTRGLWAAITIHATPMWTYTIWTAYPKAIAKTWTGFAQR